MDWFLAYTRPNSEVQAYEALTVAHRAYEVYFPRVMTRVAHAGRILHEPRPLFPRYLFVQDDGRGVAGIRTTPGVTRLAQFMSVRQSVIDEIRSREDRATGCVKLDDVPAPSADVYVRGDAVRVTDGPLLGAGGLFERTLKGSQRAMVLLHILGRQVETTVSLREIERAA